VASSHSAGGHQLCGFAGFLAGGCDQRVPAISVSRELVIKLEQFWQEIVRAGFYTRRGGHDRLAILKLNPEPFESGTLPSLFSILPGQVNYGDSSTSREKIGEYELEHDKQSYRLGANLQ
jgi:hypothetical protein